MDIVVLAGGNTSPEMEALTGLKCRAELPYQGKRMVDIVLEAVRHLGQPIVVGEVEVHDTRHAPAGDRFVQSLGNGLEQVQSEAFLLVTSDLPFLTRQAVDHFLEHADPDALLTYPIIPMEEADRQFPDMPRTTYKLREGTFTGGNIALLNTKLIRQQLPRMEEAYANRKSVLKLGKMLGPATLLTLLVGKLVPKSVTIRGLERAIGSALGGPVKAVVTPFAGVGCDIDSAEQYQAILR